MLEKVVQTVVSVLKGFEIQKWVVAYLIMLIPVALSWLNDLDLHAEIAVSSLRATVQLLIIGLVLLPVFLSGWIIQVGLLAVMIAAGAYIAAERGKNIPKSFLIALVSVLISYGFCIAVFIVTGSLEVAPNIIIPISGMLIGNAVNSVSLVYHRSAKDFEENQSMIEAMLIDGANMKESLLIPKRETLKNAMIPKIDSLKTLGIVHIPGAMAGMMVAGADPLQAAGYQILLFFGIVGIGGLSSIFSGEMAYRSIFVKHYPHLKSDKSSDKKYGRKK